MVSFVKTIVTPDKVAKEFKLYVTDIFGTYLNVGQKVYYERDVYGARRFVEGTIIGISSNGDVILEWGKENTKTVSTISKHVSCLNSDRTGTARFNQLQTIKWDEESVL
jgi:hypothetical protein